MNKLARWWSPLLVACTLAFSPLAQGSVRAADESISPVLVVSVASTDELLGDVVYLTEAAGAGDVGRLIMLMAGPYTTGLDKQRPSGGYMMLDDRNLPSGVAFIPVTNLELTLSMLEQQLGKPEDAGDGVLELATDRPNSVFVKEQDGWAFVSDKKSNLANLPEDPAELLDGLDQEYTLAVRVNVQQIPAPLRDKAIEELRKGFEENLEEQVDNEKQAEFARKLGESLVQTTVSVIEESDHLTLGWEVDAENQRTYLDLNLVALKGSELANQMAQCKEAKSAFSGFLLPDAAATFHVTAKCTPAEVEQMLLLVDIVREEAMKGIDEDDNLANDAERKTAKQIVGKFLDIAAKSSAAGKINCGASLVLKPNSMTFVGGGFLADGPKLEAALRDLANFARQKDPRIPQVDFDSQTYQGVEFHRIQVPLGNTDQEAKDVLGDPLEVVVGTGPKAVYLALGKDAADTLKQVIDLSIAGADEKLPPGELNIALLPVLQFIASVDSSPQVEQVIKAIEENAEQDKISLTALPMKRGFGLRFEMEEGILKVIGEAAKALAPLFSQ